MASPVLFVAKSFVHAHRRRKPGGGMVLVRPYSTKTRPIAEWLDGSKVVDAKGRPLVVHHSTAAQFSQFEPHGIGIHFGTKEQATSRTRKTGGTRMLQAHLAVKNPIRVEDAGADWLSPVVWARAVANAEGRTIQDVHNDPFYQEHERLMQQEVEADVAALKLKQPVTKRRARIVRMIEARGYDGAVYQNKYEGSGTSWIAFRADQIRLLKRKTAP